MGRTIRRWGPYALVALGGVWRLAHTPLARFTGDEASFFHTAARIASRQAHPALGPPVSGTAAHHPGPLFYDVMALGAAVWRHPLACSAVVALVATAALGALVAHVRRTRGETVAWGTAVVAAWGPWPVLYADRPWNSNVAPWLAWLGLFALWRAHEAATRRPAAWAAALVVLGVLPQFHLSAPIAWAGALAWWHRAGRQRPPRRAIAWASVLLVLAYAPALAWDAAHGWANVRAIAHRGAHGDAPLASVLDVFYYLWAFGSTAIGYHVRKGYWGGYDPWRDFDLAPELAGWYGPLGAAAVALSGILALAGGLAELRAALRRRDGGRPDLLRTALAAGTAVALVLLGASHKPVYPHYVNLLLPLVLVWPARGAAAIIGAAAPRARPILAAASLASALAGAWLTHRYYREVDDLVSVSTTQAAVRTVSAAQHGRPFQLVFHTYPNGYAWRVMARDVLGMSWPARADAPDVWTVWPARAWRQRGRPVGRQAWQVGPIVLVQHGRRPLAGTPGAVPP